MAPPRAVAQGPVQQGPPGMDQIFGRNQGEQFNINGPNNVHPDLCSIPTTSIDSYEEYTRLERLKRAGRVVNSDLLYKDPAPGEELRDENGLPILGEDGKPLRVLKEVPDDLKTEERQGKEETWDGFKEGMTDIVGGIFGQERQIDEKTGKTTGWKTNWTQVGCNVASMAAIAGVCMFIPGGQIIGLGLAAYGLFKAGKSFLKNLGIAKSDKRETTYAQRLEARRNMGRDLAFGFMSVLPFARRGVSVGAKAFGNKNSWLKLPHKSRDAYREATVKTAQRTHYDAKVKPLQQAHNKALAELNAAKASGDPAKIAAAQTKFNEAQTALHNGANAAKTEGLAMTYDTLGRRQYVRALWDQTNLKNGGLGSKTLHYTEASSAATFNGLYNVPELGSPADLVHSPNGRSLNDKYFMDGTEDHAKTKEEVNDERKADKDMPSQKQRKPWSIITGPGGRKYMILPDGRMVPEEKGRQIKQQFMRTGQLPGGQGPDVANLPFNNGQQFATSFNQPTYNNYGSGSSYGNDYQQRTQVDLTANAQL